MIEDEEITLKAKYDDLLNELVILEKKYLLYSHGHEFVEQAAVDLLKIINKLHNITPKIRIVALGNNLVINDVEYDENNPRGVYLSQLLGGRGIFSIDLNPGVEWGSILDFLYFLNAIPNKSNLLYHPDIQFAIHNIDSIEVEEMDYGGIKYGYEDEPNIYSTHDVRIKSQLHETLKNLNSKSDSLRENELIDMALEEISEMPQNEVPDYVEELSEDVVSEILERAKTKEESISPSLIDLLETLDSANKLAGEDRKTKSGDGMSDDQVNKLIEREAYELYISEAYRQHLQNLSAFDNQYLDGFNEIDLFNKVLINKTVLIALIHLINNELDTDVYDSFVGSIHNYIDEFLENRDWHFVHSISNNELVYSYLEQDSTVEKLSEIIRNNNSFGDNYVLELLEVSGSKNVNWLIDSYIDNYGLETRRHILSLILLFGETASVEVIKKIIGDPTHNISLLMPIIENYFKAIPRNLSLQLLAVDLADAKLLAIKILLTQNDDKVKYNIEQIIRKGDYNLVFRLLDLIREYKITEITEVLIRRIRTLYISEDNLKFILKMIDTISSIDNQSYQRLAKRLKRKWFTLSPKNLRIIKKHLIGVSYEHRSR